MKKNLLFAFFCLGLLLQPLPASTEELSATVNSSGETLDEQLVYRVASGSAADVKILLDSGANANAKNAIGDSVLLIAAMRDHQDSTKIAEYLVGAGALTSYKNSAGDSAFTSAIKFGLPKTVEYLMSLNPNLNMTDASGKSLETLANERGEPQISAIFQKLNENQAQAKAAADAEWRKKTSSTNLKKLLRTYSIQNCYKEYLTFYSKYDADENFDIEAYDLNIEKLNEQISANEADLKKYFKLGNKSLSQVENMSRQTIVNQLAELGSSTFRKRSGVGTDADMQRRCGKIANDISLRVSVR